MDNNYYKKRVSDTPFYFNLSATSILKKISLLLILILGAFEGFGQTTLISPTGDGGFESGTTFTSNNWSSTLGTATQNQWVVNTGATAGFSGTRCAYISQNSGSTPPPYTYDIGATRATHFYRNITIPPGETDITLSFNWLGRGESTFDRMRVWIVPTSYTPAYGSEITTTGAAPTGRIQVGATNYSAQATWTSASFKLPIAYAGTTVRLVFEWRNDDSVGTQPPAAIDNISLISKILTAPANDLCANATALPCGTTNLAGTTVATTNIANNTGCANISNYGVWYTFTGDGQQTTVSTNPSFDIKLSIATGTCGTLSNIVCTDASPETATITTVSGIQYYVYVASYGNSSTTTGTFTISRSCTAAPVPPSNDLCANATALPCGTTNLAGTTVNTTNIANNTGCANMSNFGVWYTFTGDGQQTTVSTNPSFDIKLSIATGTCGTLSNIVCTDASPETATFTTVSGTQYYVYVASYGNSSTTTGTFTISRSCTAAPVPPVNDDCVNAIKLTVNTLCSYSNYTNADATDSTGVPAPGCAGYSGGDVWFSTVVPANGILLIDTLPGVLSDGGMAIYSGICEAMTLIECDDDDSDNGAMPYIQRSGLTPGSTVYIRVWEYGNNNNGSFGICVTTPPPPINDNPCSSIELNVNTACAYQTFTNIGATATGGVTAPGCGGYLGGDVWFNFVVPANGIVRIDSNTGYITDGGMAVYSGSCGALTLVQCDNDSSVNGVMPYIALSGLTPGTMLYIRFWEFGNDSNGTFNICISTPCTPGSGIGNSSAGCPTVITGGLGLLGVDPSPINSCISTGCVDLEATYLTLGQTTNYSVAPIAYNPPPYQFGCLANPVSVNVDDVWSPVINLPFTFCFYGNTYNSCVMGSNGVLSFNSGLASSDSGFETNFNLPSLINAEFFGTNYFYGPSIYGVHHDIDPSEGGQVGWELITLPTGCRALVASWENVPMFSNNSILYTGMMVLYENTNIIEVYTKEKNIDNYNISPWNDGNAAIGLQNSNGTQAVVPPSRNTLDSNWNTSQEAWRFTPSGTTLTSVKWYEGSGTTGTFLGSSNTLNVCPSTTTTYTAEVTYNTCTGGIIKIADETTVTVIGNKTWNGSVNSDWNTPNNWTPIGVPTNTDCVVVPVVITPRPYPIISNVPNAVGYNLSVYSNASLTINSNQNLTITDKITVQAPSTGSFTVNNSASLIQINNVLNSGNITYKRDAPSVRTLDYVYWSSPVGGFNVSNIVSPYAFGAVYKWNTTLPNGNAGWGQWENAAGNPMVAGKGYIARTPGASPFNNTSFNILNGSFTGVPNNGNITIPIERGPDQNLGLHYGTNGTQITNLSDNWNLLGNPYPSAIRGSQFLFDNRTKIEGNIRLWTHGLLPSVVISSPFYGSYLSNYSAGDYSTYNFTGTTCCPAAGSDIFIGAGQGFFVQMIDGLPVAAADNITVAFNNNLRNSAFSNSTFYKMQNSTTTNSTFDVNSIERNRIWLDLVNTSNQSDRTLFGYIENATMEKDSFYDCITQNSGSTQIYSVVGDDIFSIQGRALPFDVNDEVPIGINVPTQGDYTIAIAAIDGLFNEQPIYLKDELLNITHNIKSNPYHFTSNTQSGGINDRFKIVYVDNTLGNPTYTLENTVKVMVNDDVAVSSSNLQMESIIVYNLLGQELDTYKKISSNYVVLSNLRKNNVGLLLKIKLQTGEVLTKKIIF